MILTTNVDPKQLVCSESGSQALLNAGQASFLRTKSKALVTDECFADIDFQSLRSPLHPLLISNSSLKEEATKHLGKRRMLPAAPLSKRYS